jgi:hypothetical protein
MRGISRLAEEMLAFLQGLHSTQNSNALLSYTMYHITVFARLSS